MRPLEPGRCTSRDADFTPVVIVSQLPERFLVFVKAAALTVIGAICGCGPSLSDCANSTFVVDLKFSPDGSVLATAHDDGFIRFWNVENQGHLRSIQHTTGYTKFQSIAYAPDGELLAAGGSDATVVIWETQSWREIARFRSGMLLGIARPLAFSPDGMTLAVGNCAGSIWFWNKKTGEQSRVLADEGFRSHLSMAFSPQGDLFVTGGLTGDINGWSLPNMIPQFAWKAHENMINKLAFSPDGRIVASASMKDRGTVFDEIKLWELDTGHEIARLTGHFGSLVSLNFSSDGSLLGTTDMSNMIVWDTQTNKKIWQRRMCLRIKGIAFSPDGMIIAVGSYTGRSSYGIKFLDARTGKPRSAAVAESE